MDGRGVREQVREAGWGFLCIEGICTEEFAPRNLLSKWWSEVLRPEVE